MKTQRKQPIGDVKILYGRAAERCAFSTCKIKLTFKKTEKGKTKQMGKIAHIIAHSPNGPRADNSYTGELDAYPNWILLCPNHHDEIDAQPTTYTVEVLLDLKAKHEKWVEDRLSEGTTEFSFAELEVAAKAISLTGTLNPNDFRVIAPQEKIKKNGLTESSHTLIVMGLSRSHDVADYITKSAQLDNNFPDILKSRFQEKYRELKQNLSGDALFEAMFDFAKAGSDDFKIQGACLAILCHLFEICEIFEK